MKNLLIIIALILLVPLYAYAGPCLDEAIELCNKYPNTLIKYGITASGGYHAEAVWVKDGIEYPVDGEDTIIKVIPQNKYLKYYSKKEAKDKWR